MRISDWAHSVMNSDSFQGPINTERNMRLLHWTLVITGSIDEFTSQSQTSLPIIAKGQLEMSAFLSRRCEWVSHVRASPSTIRQINVGQFGPDSKCQTSSSYNAERNIAPRKQAKAIQIWLMEVQAYKLFFITSDGKNEKRIQHSSLNWQKETLSFTSLAPLTR